MFSQTGNDLKVNSSLKSLSFIHIPKTAGLSLHSELEEFFGRAKTLRIGGIGDRQRFADMNQKDLDNYKFISGHISLLELHERGIYFPAISVVRDPLKRLVSLQNYLTQSGREEHTELRYHSVNSLLEDMAQERKLNMQCWHLSGKMNAELAIESIRKHRVFVAPLEHYQDFLDSLSSIALYHFRNIKTNTTKYPESSFTASIDKSLLEYVCGEDFKLYAYITKNYSTIKNDFLSMFN